MSKNKVISFDSRFDSMSNNISENVEECERIETELTTTSSQIEELWSELKDIPGALRLISNNNEFDRINSSADFNVLLDDIIIPDYKGHSDLTPTDIVVSILAGVVASVIDIVLVGTPEVVKIYKGGENFDGSILTGILRKIGNGDDGLSKMLKWLSDNCKVPYDISQASGICYPNNHRLRNFAHDPLFGLFFAIADIIMGTATFIDDNGNLRVLVNDNTYPQSQKWLAVLYYLGHLLSDVCTARGLPIPGFITTQLFAKEGDKDSIAKKAEMMYYDGYDVRHLASMSTPVVVKDMLIKAYLHFFRDDEDVQLSTIAEREITKNKKEVFEYKMRLISDAVACSGNALKFFLPPTAGNPTALNLPEWASLLKDSIVVAKYELRDKTIEETIIRRRVIDENWKILLSVQ